MAVLGVGFVFPQAFADQMGNTVNAILGIVQNIQAKVTAIKTTTDNLQTQMNDLVVTSTTHPVLYVGDGIHGVDIIDDTNKVGSCSSLGH